MQTDGHTRLLCLIGSPVSHSGSPAMYTYSFEKLGINYTYLAFDVGLKDAKQAVDAMRLLNVRGFNITMPLKTAVAGYCDRLSDAARLIGAVNTVVNDDGVLTGHNTDGLGWVRACKEGGFDVAGKKMTIAGSGGAATAVEITAALCGMKEISIFAMKDSFFENACRTVKKIEENIPGCKVRLFDLADQDAFYREISDSDIFTNATRVGMKPMDNESLIKDMSAFRRDLFVSDVVYNPRMTRLLQDASDHGCRIIPGIGMLLWQGAEAFKLYTGQEMPAKEVEKLFFS